MTRRYTRRTNTAYWIEQRMSKLWAVMCRGRVSYWFDPVPSFFYRLRKRVERTDPYVQARMKG